MDVSYRTTLELDKIIARAVQLCTCAETKEMMRAIEPFATTEEERYALAQTNAINALLLKNGSPRFGAVHEVRRVVAHAAKGGILSMGELLEIAAALRNFSGLAQWYGLTDHDMLPTDDLFFALAPQPVLEKQIGECIISPEEMADTASVTLRDLRRKIRATEDSIRTKLDAIIKNSTTNKFLQDAVVSIRNGRYVVPVRAEYRGEVGGVIHDVSSTGSTVFVEPTAVVEANARIMQLHAQEQEEITRILTAFSGQVASLEPQFSYSYDAMLQIDLLLAKARLAVEQNAFMPQVNDSCRFALKKARHPLIDKKKVVPVDIALGEKYDTLVITGPNTGGKTVTLKTVGLLTLMAECGLHVPAGDGSVLSTFDAILADIGDEQSIAQSLSTFSSHMRTIVDVVAQCDDRTLVLFDELGAGTDPAEGAALATAIIEFCRKLGSRVVATTHYAELKLYAMRTKGVINASCEFDVETLRPTYKLLIGIPGKSNAFAISRKLGLSEEILKEADDLVDKSDKDFEDVLSQLEQQRQQMELARQEAERLKQETAKIKQQNEEYQEQLRKEKEKAVESARREAQHIIDEARAAANIASEELKAMRKQLADSADVSGINQRQAELRRNLNEVEDKLRASQPKKERPKPTRGILVGDTVELLKLGTKASVLAINKDGTYQLQAGILKLTAKPDEIYLLENENPYKAKGGHPAHSGREMKMTAMPTEVDLRGMDTVEAICVLERYLDEAMRANLSTVRIIHGKGTGALRAAVQQSLKKNKFVKSFRLGVYGEGEDGVTIAEFR